MRLLRSLWLVGLVLGLGLTLLASIGCGGEEGQEEGQEAGEEPREEPTRGQPEKTIPGIRSELVATAADGVTDMAFAPDGRLFFTELNTGNVRVITPEGELLPEPFVQIDIPLDRESSLQGIAVDPEFEANHYIYIYLTLASEIEPGLGRPILMRFTDANNEGTDPTELLEIPLADPGISITIGGRIHFGPDGYLYISVGDRRDARFEQLAEDLSSPFGKILRVTRQGVPAPDNPFVNEPGADPRIYAYGLRNTGDFTFQPENGRIYAADRAAPCDELNIIQAGKDYSWPRSLDVSGAPCQNPGGIEPKYHFSLPGTEPGDVDSRVFPTGIEFVSGEVYPALGEGLLVCERETTFMRRLQLTGPDDDLVIDDSVVVQDCRAALTADPGGIIYYSIHKDIRRLPPQ